MEGEGAEMGAARPGAETGRISRRAFLGSTLGTTARLLAGCKTPHSEAPAAPANDLLAGDALDQAARVRSGQATATELVEATIERVEALYNHYRAIQFGEEDDHFGWGTVCPPLADVAAA